MLDWVHKSFNELETGQKPIFKLLNDFFSPWIYGHLKKEKNKLIANLLVRMNPAVRCIGNCHGIESLLSIRKGVNRVLFV